MVFRYFAKKKKKNTLNRHTSYTFEHYQVPTLCGNATLAEKKRAPTSVPQVTSCITTRPLEGINAENLQANSKSIFRILNPCTSSLVIPVRQATARKREGQKGLSIFKLNGFRL